MKIALWIFLGVVVSVGLYFLYVWFDVYAKVKMAPREEMFMCDKHGPIRKKHIIKFQIGPDDYVDYCPSCYHQKMSAAEKIN